MFALGLLLVVLGAALAAAEAHVPSHGALGSGAVVALAAGVALLLSAAGSATLVAVARGARRRRRRRRAGCGCWCARRWRRIACASATRSSAGVGVARAEDCVFVDGALWRARLWDLEDEAPLARGDPVVVEHVNGLTLTVRPAEEWEVAP